MSNKSYQFTFKLSSGTRKVKHQKADRLFLDIIRWAEDNCLTIAGGYAEDNHSQAPQNPAKGGRRVKTPKS